MNTFNGQRERSATIERDELDSWRRALDRRLLVIAEIHVAITAWNALYNGSGLTLAQRLIGLAIWLALPAVAVYLLWRGRAAGRWFLIVLFGFRGVGEAAIIAWTVGSHLSHLFTGPFRMNAFQALFYSASAAWLVFRPDVVLRRKGDVQLFEGPPCEKKNVPISPPSECMATQCKAGR